MRGCKVDLKVRDSKHFMWKSSVLDHNPDEENKLVHQTVSLIDEFDHD